MELTTVSPIDGRPLASYSLASAATIDGALDRAVAAQRAWAAEDIESRASVLNRVAASLRAGARDAAALITVEMGKVSAEADAEIEKSALVCEYYGDRGKQHLSNLEVEADWSASYVQFPPLGVVLGVMPWNYPIWQVMRAAAPALMAGNAFVLKHAPNVTGSALLLRELLRGAGVPSGLFEVLVIADADVRGVIVDERIAAVTFTGSEETGVKVADACAQTLKRSVLELGGSDPFIVLEDADVDTAAHAAVAGRFLNAGQSCIAAKRFIAVDAVANRFEDAFAAATEALVVGDPRNVLTDIGPLARLDLRDKLAGQLRAGLASGGRLAHGGAAVPTVGAYFAPAIVSDVELGNPLVQEETFGPVAALMRARDEQHAIELANASRYGLAASIWSGDPDRARRFAWSIQAGAVFVNAPSVSDVHLPFGGVKRSGWGRELGSFGIREFVNVQAVAVGPRA